MGINIYTGSKQSSKQKSKSSTASRTVRAQAAKAALSTPSETSSSGSTAVGTKGTLSKIGNVVGKVAGIAGKFLPGIGGTIANGISKIFNDPEWWQSVPGEALTTNEPLRAIPLEFENTSLPESYGIREAILEFVAFARGETVYEANNSDDSINFLNGVIAPTENAITQYLMPQIRKVVNAVPLQSASAYRQVLVANATLYAIWRMLRKYDYMTKHGQTYLANMNDEAFPILQVGNAAWLQSTINRLEEYLRANVRLPHTLCEYLAWRFGRVYRTNDSAKSGLVLYDIFPLNATPDIYDEYIRVLMNQIGDSTETQLANADLYNTYYDHDYMVEIRDDTQFKYDKKEFLLRLNLKSDFTGNDAASSIIAMDSSLDNPTTFMASTVSAQGRIGQERSVLFPVSVQAFTWIPKRLGNHDLSDSKICNAFVTGSPEDTDNQALLFEIPGALTWGSVAFNDFVTQYGIELSGANVTSTIWAQGTITLDYVLSVSAASTNQLAEAVVQLILGKSVDLYNYGVVVPLKLADGTILGIDATQLSIDAGRPTNATIATEHVYAFANLVDIDRKHSMSYKQAEKLVARDTADFIESLDVSTVK